MQGYGLRCLFQSRIGTAASDWSMDSTRPVEIVVGRKPGISCVKFQGKLELVWIVAWMLTIGSMQVLSLDNMR